MVVYTLSRLLALALFALAALSVPLSLLAPTHPWRLSLLALLAAVTQLRLVSVPSQVLIAPRAPALRPLPFSDADARLLHRWILAFAGLNLFLHALQRQDRIDDEHAGEPGADEDSL